MQPEIHAADLLVGSDHDFVVNLYIAVLDRWPDPEGYANMRLAIAQGGAARKGALHSVVASPEAAQRGRRLVLDEPLLPSTAEQALAAQLALRTEFLLARIAEVRPAAASRQTPMPEVLVRELRAELAALRAEMRERLAALAVREAPLPLLPAPTAQDHVHDLLALAEARMELRIRALEKRLP